MSPNLAINTARLHLQPLCEEDAADVYSYCRDPDVSRNTSWLTHQSIEDAHAYIGRAVKKASIPPDRLHQIWAIRRQGSKQVIGTVDLIQNSPSEAHTDYVLSRAWWGEGLMTEAVRAVTAWGFASVPVIQRIHSGCLARNAASSRVLLRSGFRLFTCESIQFGAKFDHQTLEVSRYELLRAEDGPGRRG